MRKRPLDPEDIALFRNKMSDVSPIIHNLAETPRPSAREKRTKTAATQEWMQLPTAVMNTTYEPDAVTISHESVIQFRRPGIQDSVFRKLQRGQIPIITELDLHGMTVNKAKIALDRFMEEHLRQLEKQVCVRIIHGKGIGSKDGLPVIKRQTQLWLQCNINVLAYSSCQPRDGGTGALYVLVKNCA